MGRVLLLLLVLLVAHCVAQTPKAPSKEQQLLIDSVQPARLRQSLEALTRHPHVFGSAQSEAEANLIAADWRNSFGPMAVVSIQQLKAVSTMPIHRELLLGDTALPLDEPAVPEDPTSGDPTITQPWLGYSANGTVTTGVVYGNYCEQGDYKYLASIGVSVRGQIVLCRYGRIFRAQKAQFAEEAGAVGVLIYTDPADDGFAKGDVFPAGPARPELGVQRGTLAYGQFCQGDPSEERRTGICGGVPQLYPRIPCQPISWGAAQPILQSLGGPSAPAALGWQGGLPFHYHIGPGTVPVTLSLLVDRRARDGFNVLAHIAGQNSSDTVALGCHHDAWVFGAADPLSGQAVMSELAKVLRTMWDGGWRPKRSIVFAAWDGEEYNCLGSTAYTESPSFDSSTWQAYVNIDAVVSTWFPKQNPQISVDISPLLVDIFADAVAMTPSPVNASQSCKAHFDGSFGVLGDGSDYAAFIHRKGVSCINFAWGNPDMPSLLYHSTYDSFFAMATFGDPEFAVHAASTRIAGLIMYALSSADEVRWNVTNLANAIKGYKASVIAQFPALQVDWSGFDAAADGLTRSAQSIAIDDAGRDQRNRVLGVLERSFLLPVGQGLPSRPYYLHVLQAPNLINDYGYQLLPALAYYASTQNGGADVQGALDNVTAAIRAASAQVDTLSGPALTTPAIVVLSLLGVALLLFVLLLTRDCVNRRRKTAYVSV